MQPLKTVHGANISYEGNSFKVSTGDPCLEGEDLHLFFMKKLFIFMKPAGI